MPKLSVILSSLNAALFFVQANLPLGHTVHVIFAATQIFIGGIAIPGIMAVRPSEPAQVTEPTPALTGKQSAE